MGRTYKDEVSCYVISMYAWHLLFGHPWQYGRHATYEGFCNTYSLCLNVKKTMLTPLPPKPLPFIQTEEESEKFFNSRERRKTIVFNKLFDFPLLIDVPQSFILHPNLENLKCINRFLKQVEKIRVHKCHIHELLIRGPIRNPWLSL